MASLIDFGRETCNLLLASERREWLVTNGIGGYACGTVAGVATRRYHGLLIAALKPPLGRTLLLAGLRETAQYCDRQYELFTVRRSRAHLAAYGYDHIERFRLDGTTPTWTFACGDALLEKRVWMERGHNTTYVEYRLVRAAGEMTLSIQAAVGVRGHHSTIAADAPVVLQTTRIPNGVQITGQEGGADLYLLSDRATYIEEAPSSEQAYLSIEDQRGFDDATDQRTIISRFEGTLQPGESVCVVASTEASPNLDAAVAYEVRQVYEAQLIETAGLPPAADGDTLQGTAAQLVLAADQFIVRRATAGDPDGRTVIAGYPWFGDWGRDTMIALPGLTLATRQYDTAASILLTYAAYIDEGMLPNRFPEAGEAPEYNTVDATLWYFEAIRAYVAATQDTALLRPLVPVLRTIIDWHVQGTRYQIRRDSDGLLYAGEEGVQLTWMDAKYGDWVVTPRTGKAVEINALWYNALRSMAEFERSAGGNPDRYLRLADDVQEGFTRFWNDDAGYCYDVIGGPEGSDPALRPNQILAVALRYSPLSAAQKRAVVDVCARHLLTSHGLRSLAPAHRDYVPHYRGDPKTRDAAYHQGTVWSWLIGPFARAHLRVYGDRRAARAFVLPLLYHLREHSLGQISEIFDGDPPFTPNGCFAQAWSVAEVLRVLRETA